MERIPIRPLRSVSSVRSGFSFRERVVGDPIGEVHVVQMKDLREDAIVPETVTRVSSQGIAQNHMLQRGDVLFVGKGQNNRALAYDLDLPKAVAASAFFVLTPDPSQVDPHYLAWWINQDATQEYLRQNMAGTYIPNITRPVVEGIQVPLPPLGQQRLIAAVHGLALAEQRILDQLRTKRQQVIDQLLNASIETHAP